MKENGQPSTEWRRLQGLPRGVRARSDVEVTRMVPKESTKAGRLTDRVFDVVQSECEGRLAGHNVIGERDRGKQRPGLGMEHREPSLAQRPTSLTSPSHPLGLTNLLHRGDMIACLRSSRQTTKRKRTYEARPRICSAPGRGSPGVRPVASRASVEGTVKSSSRGSVPSIPSTGRAVRVARAARAARLPVDSTPPTKRTPTSSRHPVCEPSMTGRLLLPPAAGGRLDIHHEHVGAAPAAAKLLSRPPRNAGSLDTPNIQAPASFGTNTESSLSPRGPDVFCPPPAHGGGHQSSPQGANARPWRS